MANRILAVAGLLVLSTLVLAFPPSEIRPSPEFFIQDLGTLPGDTDSYAWGDTRLSTFAPKRDHISRNSSKWVWSLGESEYVVP